MYDDNYKRNIDFVILLMRTKKITLKTKQIRIVFFLSKIKSWNVLFEFFFNLFLTDVLENKFG